MTVSWLEFLPVAWQLHRDTINPLISNSKLFIRKGQTTRTDFAVFVHHYIMIRLLNIFVIPSDQTVKPLYLSAITNHNLPQGALQSAQHMTPSVVPPIPLTRKKTVKY